MIYVVGIGPGSKDMMTLEAIKTMENADVIVGYKTYINLITEFIRDNTLKGTFRFSLKSIIAFSSFFTSILPISLIEFMSILFF